MTFRIPALLHWLLVHLRLNWLWLSEAHYIDIFGNMVLDHEVHPRTCQRRPLDISFPFKLVKHPASFFIRLHGYSLWHLLAVITACSNFSFGTVCAFDQNNASLFHETDCAGPLKSVPVFMHSLMVMLSAPWSWWSLVNGAGFSFIPALFTNVKLKVHGLIFSWDFLVAWYKQRLKEWYLRITGRTKHNECPSSGFPVISLACRSRFCQINLAAGPLLSYGNSALSFLTAPSRVPMGRYLGVFFILPWTSLNP